MYFLIIGVAAFVDGLATGVWVGKKWVSKTALEASVKSALDRATTLPAGGLTAVATEVTDGVKAVADKVTEVATEVNPAVASLATGAADLRALLAAAHK
jgi:hypothetical protein